MSYCSKVYLIKETENKEISISMSNVQKITIFLLFLKEEDTPFILKILLFVLHNARNIFTLSLQEVKRGQERVKLYMLQWQMHAISLSINYQF